MDRTRICVNNLEKGYKMTSPDFLNPCSYKTGKE